MDGLRPRKTTIYCKDSYIYANFNVFGLIIEVKTIKDWQIFKKYTHKKKKKPYRRTMKYSEEVQI